jgi:hypothetical protein
MQIYEISYRSRINEADEELTTDEIKKVLADVEKNCR